MYYSISFHIIFKIVQNMHSKSTKNPLKDPPLKWSEVAQSCLTLSVSDSYQAPPSMGFSGQQYRSGVLLPSPKAAWDAIKCLKKPKGKACQNFCLFVFNFCTKEKALLIDCNENTQGRRLCSLKHSAKSVRLCLPPWEWLKCGRN